MPVTKVGIVFYADDPEKKVFRIVYPERDDRELRDPQWTSLGTDPNRRAVLLEVDPTDPRVRFTGTP